MLTQKPAKILAIVPAFNEENTIVGVIESLASGAIRADILVVNDDSADETSKRARETGKAMVIDLSQNLGIGGCVQTGFRFAVENNYDTAFQFDADGQHQASDLPALLGPLGNDETDVVIGSRFISNNDGYRSSFPRRLGIRILSVTTRVLIGQGISDCTSGFRAYNRKAIAFFAENYPVDYPEPEAIIMLGKNGFRIREVGVNMLPRQGGKSSISFRRGTFYYMIKVMLGMAMTAVRPKIQSK
jgi:glycosyltransferase involved in cell wall biosynthesis